MNKNKSPLCETHTVDTDTNPLLCDYQACLG